MRARIDGWLVAIAQQAILAHQRPEIATASPDATNTSIEKMGITPKTRPPMPDLVAPSPVSRKSHSKRTIWARPVWTAYSIVHAKFIAPQEHQPIIPTENAGSSNKPTGEVPQTRRMGLKAMTTARSPDHQIKEGKGDFPRKSKW